MGGWGRRGGGGRSCRGADEMTDRLRCMYAWWEALPNHGIISVPHAVKCGLDISAGLEDLGR
jgi:hypothetical protein